jgi:hypothetical protein
MNNMRIWMTTLIVLAWATFVSAQGIVCIDPVTITVEEKGTESHPESTFTVAIDDRPAQTITANSCGVFSNLNVTADHMVKIDRDGKRETSFKFNFKTKGSDHLRLWYRTQYGTWQLWKPGRKHACAYLKRGRTSNKRIHAAN